MCNVQTIRENAGVKAHMVPGADSAVPATVANDISLKGRPPPPSLPPSLWAPYGLLHGHGPSCTGGISHVGTAQQLKKDAKTTGGLGVGWGLLLLLLKRPGVALKTWGSRVTKVTSTARSAREAARSPLLPTDAPRS